MQENIQLWVTVFGCLQQAFALARVLVERYDRRKAARPAESRD